MSALRQRGLRPRRGSALILVLLMTLAVAALAVAAIFMTSSAGLVARFYDKERVAAYAAESGLQMALATMRSSSGFVISDADTLSTFAELQGVPVLDADGQAIPGANVWVYAMRTGDVSAAGERTVTLIARAYDSFGTRHVRRVDVRQESITKYALFFDNFPSGLTFGPTVLSGRVHSNGNLSNENQTRFMDSVTVVGENDRDRGTFATGLLEGAEAVSFPRNDAFTALATQAAGDNLSITPTANRATRLEFVTLRLTAADTGAFVRFFELEAGLGDTLLRVNPSGASTYHRFDHPIIQKQCGAFYFRGGRWQFFPVATHRASWAWNIISSSGFPTAPSGGNGTSSSDRETAARNILQLPTSRCFPAGSPYLMPTERLTNASGVISGTASQNTFPWGTVSGFPAAKRYGGMDTTFTHRPRTCTINNSSDGLCNNNTWRALGTWRDWTGGFTGAAQPADTNTKKTHWPIDVRRNTAFEGLVNVNGSTMVSGVVRGNVTLRVGGTASLIDHLVYESDPNDPSKAPCTDMLGLIATQDILVVDGAMTRLRRYGGNSTSNRYDLHLGGGPNFLLHGFLLSSGGTVGVQNPASLVGIQQIECRAPPDATAGRRANGGCFVHVGGAAMRTYSEYSQGNGQNRGGMVPFPVADRCQTTGRQPPGFPSIASFRVLRSLAVDASRANTEPKILALLRSLRGTNLD